MGKRVKSHYLSGKTGSLIPESGDATERRSRVEQTGGGGGGGDGGWFFFLYVLEN